MAWERQATASCPLVAVRTDAWLAPVNGVASFFTAAEKAVTWRQREDPGRAEAGTVSLVASGCPLEVLEQTLQSPQVWGALGHMFFGMYWVFLGPRNTKMGLGLAGDPSV